MRLDKAGSSEPFVWAQVWPSIWSRLGPALLIAALLLPFGLPAVDHHGIERLANHEHVGSADLPPDHTHAFQQPHEHSLGATVSLALSALPSTAPALVAGPMTVVEAFLTAGAWALLLWASLGVLRGGSFFRLEASRRPCDFYPAGPVIPPRAAPSFA